MMEHIKKIILFIARIIAATFVSIFSTYLAVIVWMGLSYTALRYEHLSNLLYSAKCYGLHAVPTCEFHLLGLMGSLLSFLSEVDSDILNRLAREVLFYSDKYLGSGFINYIFEAYLFVLKSLFQLGYYVVPGFIAVLVFMFMWNDTKPKNTISCSGHED
jgi:hypothetical protein